jgi:hypothetical protein
MYAYMYTYVCMCHALTSKHARLVILYVLISMYVCIHVYICMYVLCPDEQARQVGNPIRAYEYVCIIHVYMCMYVSCPGEQTRQVGQHIHE